MSSGAAPSLAAERWARARRHAVLGVALAGVVATAAQSWRWFVAYHRNVVDDALISMVYARRLATGDGLVFNPGERVEGYTNFLWTLTMAPVYWLSRLFSGDFVEWCVATSILVSALDVALVVVIGRRLWGDRVLPIIAAVGLCVLDNSYTVWAMMALESHYVALWALATLAVWTSELRHRALLTGLCLAAVPMARPDGALFVGAFALSEGLHALAPLLRRDRALARRRLGALLLAGSVAALLFGAYFAWKWRYYGWPFPNTYYLKLGSSRFDGLVRGIGYVKTFVEERGELPLVAVLALPFVRNPTVRTLALWVPAHVAYVAKIGGDFYPGHRFLVQLIPALALLTGHALFGFGDFLRRPRVALWVARAHARAALASLSALYVAGGLGQLWQLGLSKGPYALEIRAWRHKVDEQRRYMSWLAERSNPDDYMCTGDIGSAGLYAKLRVIDYYGVIDAFVAHQDNPSLGRGKAGHEKMADVGYVLSRRPKYIKWGYLPGIFWNDGYYFDTSIPLDVGMPGLWVRDDLRGRGKVDEAASFRFSAQPYAGWTATGNAFEVWPTNRPAPGQMPISYAEGFFVSSFHPVLGDRATGTLKSAPFPLTGDRLLLMIAGGHDPDNLRVSLLVDGDRRFSETGARSETFGRREWDVSALRGRQAELEIVDHVDGNWGHILVDEVVQWVADAGKGG
ncbi:MAG: hypothetical protein HS104_42065 [Polyangiaceae bacterium]|nr:hypothetical protein [Polyangiaceae bacterium]MCL4753230.1 hypothetical protein [Myxococcales bacterium]